MKKAEVSTIALTFFIRHYINKFFKKNQKKEAALCTRKQNKAAELMFTLKHLKQKKQLRNRGDWT